MKRNRSFGLVPKFSIVKDMVGHLPPRHGTDSEKTCAFAVNLCVAKYTTSTARSAETFFLVRTQELVLNRGQYFLDLIGNTCSEEHAGFDLSPHSKKYCGPHAGDGMSAMTLMSVFTTS